MQFRVKVRKVTNKQGQEVEKAFVVLGNTMLPDTLAIPGKLLKEIGLVQANENYNYYVRGSKWINKKGENRYSVWFNVIGGREGFRISPFDNFDAVKVAPIIKKAEELWNEIKKAKKVSIKDETNQ